MTPEALAQQLVEQSNRVALLKEQLEAATEERAATEAVLLDHWAATGTTQQRIHGQTIYFWQQVWASAPREAIEAAGLDEMLAVSTQSLSAYVREKLKNGEPLPPALAAEIKMTTRTALRVLRG